MGQSIDLYSYNYDKLQNKILGYCRTDDKELVNKILLACGNKIVDRYIILNQEIWNGRSCYCNVAHILDEVFKVDDIFGYIFCDYKDTDLDCMNLISSKDYNEVMKELDLK